MRYELPPGTAEDDWGTPQDEKSVFSRKLFRHFSQPPYSECVKMNEISNILHNFRKVVEIPMNFHQNQYEKRRICYEMLIFSKKSANFHPKFCNKNWVSTGAKECTFCRS